MSMRTRVVSIALLALAVAGTACGGSDNGGSTQAGGGSGSGSSSAPVTTPPPTTPAQVSGSGACALVTQQEAGSVLGTSVPVGRNINASLPINGVGSIETQTCLYGSEVLVARFDLGNAGASLFAQYRQSLTSGSDFQEVSGVGDEAFFAKGQLAVRQGNIGLIIDVGQNTGSIPGEQEKEKSLALAALARL
jgi:hypothetical protein